MLVCVCGKQSAGVDASCCGQRQQPLYKTDHAADDFFSPFKRVLTSSTLWILCVPGSVLSNVHQSYPQQEAITPADCSLQGITGYMFCSQLKTKANVKYIFFFVFCLFRFSAILTKLIIFIIILLLI